MTIIKIVYQVKPTFIFIGCRFCLSNFRCIMAQLKASKFTHNAPAGTTYNSLLDAGRTMIREKYPGFLYGTTHTLLPPIFVNVYPEQIGEDGKILPGPGIGDNDKQLSGVILNKLGEDFEAVVFRRFEQILHSNVADSPFQDCHMLWKGFTIPGYKMDALLDENPEMELSIVQFRKKHTTKRAFSLGEADIVVLVKNVGLVVIEVKRTLAKLKDGIKQCHRMADFSALVFESCGTKSTIPIAKVVVLGEPPEESNEEGATPYIKKNEGRDVWVFYKEAIENSKKFQFCWEMILRDLHQGKGLCHATSQCFDDFAFIMTGLWSMVVFNRPLECKGKSLTVKSQNCLVGYKEFLRFLSAFLELSIDDVNQTDHPRYLE